MPGKMTLLAVVAAILLGGLCWLTYQVMFAPVTTLYVVRHADRLNATDTSSLSAEGLARAEALAVVLRDAGLTRIYVTEKARTAQTAAVTAERLAIRPTVIPSADLEGLVDSLRACRGEVVLVVGHAQTIPPLLQAMDVHQPVSVLRDVYDDLFVVTVSPFRSALARLKYGAPS